MKTKEQIICPKCGFKNYKLTKKCTNCKVNLDKNHKVCPRCGKKKVNNVSKCDCGFNFTAKKISVFNGFVISVGVVLVLLILCALNQSLWNKISFGIKILLLVMIVWILMRKVFNLEHNDFLPIAELEMLQNNKVLNKMKKKSKLFIAIGVIVGLIILLCYFLFR